MSTITPKVGTNSVPATSFTAADLETQTAASTSSEIPEQQPQAPIISNAAAQSLKAEQNIGSMARQLQLSTIVTQSTSSTPQLVKTPNDHLREAIQKNDLRQIDEWIKKGADVNGKDKDGNTPLILAAASGKTQVMEALVNKHKADVTLTDKNGQTALSKAAELGRNESVKTLLTFRPKVIDKDDTAGNTAVMHAVKNGNRETAKILLNQGGADPNIPDLQGKTPLMEAVDRRDSVSVDLLLKKNANVNMQDINGKTALMQVLEKPAPASGSPTTAAGLGQLMFDAEVVKTLAKRGDPDLQDKNGNTALMLMLRKTPPGLEQLSAEILIKRSGNLDLQDQNGRTALMEASRSLHKGALKAMLDRGADSYLQDNNSRTALMNLYENDFSPDFQEANDALLPKSDLNVRDKDGKTVLFQMAERQQLGHARTLSKAGADLNIADKNGRTPLMTAAENADVNMVQLLMGAEPVAPGEPPMRKADPFLRDGSPIPVAALHIAEIQRNLEKNRQDKNDFKIQNYEYIIEFLKKEMGVY